MANPEVACRGPRHSDIADLLELMSGKGVRHGLTLLPHVGEAELGAMLALSCNKRWIVAVSGNSVVGYATLEWGEGRWRRSGRLGMAVADGCVRQGVGASLVTDVLELGFLNLDLQRIELEVYADNAAACALYERMGFHYEGLKQRVSYRDGAYVDGYAMAILNPAAFVEHIRAPRSLAEIIRAPCDEAG
jgi:putative acetyltransferase